MKTRSVTLNTGATFSVPQGIQRLDSRSTCGWQVRYQGTKYFPDGTSGPRKALGLAKRHLLERIAAMPAPSAIRRIPNSSKTGGMPVGISGPILVSKPSSGSLSAVLSVSVPVFGKANTTQKIHIGTPNTYTKARYQQALVMAVQIRALAIAAYEAAATKAKRRDAVTLTKSLRQSANGTRL